MEENMERGPVGMNDDNAARTRRETESLADILVRWLRGIMPRKGEEETVREVIEELIENRESETDAVSPGERMLLSNIFRLQGLTVDDVMVPHADIIAVDEQVPLAEIIETMTRHGHSRLPVYRDTLDNVLGMIHLKDLVGALNSPTPVSLPKLLRDVLFVPPSKRVLDLLLEMRTASHLAVVVDEFGGTDGLVTIEDLVEEIVGEIEDEHDQEAEPKFAPRGDGVFDADGRVPAETLESITGPLLSDDEREDIDTLGGVVVTLAGRVPIRGELIRHPAGVEFVVLEADQRRIRKLRITVPNQDPVEDEA